MERIFYCSETFTVNTLLHHCLAAEGEQRRTSNLSEWYLLRPKRNPSRNYK